MSFARLRLLALGALVLVLTSATASAGTAAARLTVWPEPMLAQLLLTGDRMSVGYTVETQGVNAPQGFVYVRSDRQARYERLRLKLGTSTSNGRHPRLSTVLPARFARGHRVFLYAVIRDPASGATATLPAGGASAPVSAWILHKPVVVRLGTHRYGHTRGANAVVARSDAKHVGWALNRMPPLGPATFLVARNDSVWLEDEVNSRMIVWRAGKPHTPAKTVPLPPGGASLGADVAFGPAGSLYVTRWESSSSVTRVLRVSANGTVVWQSRAGTSGPDSNVTANPHLWIDPNGALYCRIEGPALSWPPSETAAHGLLPLATPAGRPVPPAQQLRRALWGYDPAANGRRLVVDVAPNQQQLHELRLALTDRDGKVERAWRVVSRTWFSPDLPPQLVKGNPLVILDVARTGRMEHVILHLSKTGTSARFSVPFSIWGDYVAPDIRLGPNGQLYRLSTSPKTGILVGRYSLG